MIDDYRCSQAARCAHGIRLKHVALLQSGRGHGLSAVWRRMGGHLHATIPEELLREGSMQQHVAMQFPMRAAQRLVHDDAATPLSRIDRSLMSDRSLILAHCCAGRNGAGD